MAPLLRQETDEKFICFKSILIYFNNGSDNGI